MAKSTATPQTAESTETTEAPAAAPAPAATTRVLAAFTGHEGTTRIIRKQDQDFLIGVDGIATEDLVWEAGSGRKVDVTNTHEEVQAYLRKSPDFRVTTVEVPAEAVDSAG